MPTAARHAYLPALTLAVLAVVVIIATRGRLGLDRTDAIGPQPLGVAQQVAGPSVA